MKGVILAGGLGTRLSPLTRVTNKHLLPVYDKPMIYYPLNTLVEAGVRDILIVTGGNYAGDFLKLLRNGDDFGLKRLNYAYQEGEGGIADALSQAQEFAKGESICVMLGDNILENSIAPALQRFQQKDEGAMVLLKEVPDPERFGVPVFDHNQRLTKIEEKPALPKSPYAVIGVYFYDATVFDKIGALTPSKRGEYEITDVNNAYLAENALDYAVIDGWWTDAGTFESLYRATKLIHERVTQKADAMSAA
jgi:glucose-1-phosphate thymidylyltransferase